MRRTDRLFDIIQIFRDGRLHRGQELAERLEVSRRTIYRDIDTLVAAGVPISGERGVGYMMVEPVFLPPLNLTPDELETLELGLALVRATFGSTFEASAQTLTDKVRAVLPRPEMMDPARSSVGVYHARTTHEEQTALATIRRGILTRTVLTFDYFAQDGIRSVRRVRPLEIQVWKAVLTLTAWCETRQAFRVFRLDRMKNLALNEESFVPRRGQTIQDYTRSQGHDATKS